MLWALPFKYYLNPCVFLHPRHFSISDLCQHSSGFCWQVAAFLISPPPLLPHSKPSPMLRPELIFLNCLSNCPSLAENPSVVLHHHPDNVQGPVAHVVLREQALGILPALSVAHLNLHATVSLLQFSEYSLLPLASRLFLKFSPMFEMLTNLLLVFQI